MARRTQGRGGERGAPQRGPPGLGGPPHGDPQAVRLGAKAARGEPREPQGPAPLAAPRALPGWPCGTASSAPPPTSCLSPSALPPRPSQPEGQRKRQAPGRRRPPARLSGLCRRRLHRPLASSAPAPAAASARRAPARPGYYMATARFRPRLRARAPCRRAGPHARRLRRERPLLPASGPGRA